MTGTRWVALGTGQTLRELLQALKDAGLPQEPVRDILARTDAELDWRTDIRTTGAVLTIEDVHKIGRCKALPGDKP